MVQQLIKHLPLLALGIIIFISSSANVIVQNISSTCPPYRQTDIHSCSSSVTCTALMRLSPIYHHNQQQPPNLIHDILFCHCCGRLQMLGINTNCTEGHISLSCTRSSLVVVEFTRRVSLLSLR